MKSNQKRVLLFPWGIGGGAAYTGHCIILADRLRAAGYEVAFSDGGISDLIRKTGYTVLEQNLPKTGPPENIPPYLPFTSVERVYAVGARFYHYSKLKEQYLEDARIIEEWQPHLVVTDMVATAAMAARVRSIPVLSIAEADFLSREENAWMPWFKGDPMRILPYPNCLPTFNQLAQEIKHPEIKYVTDLLWGDVTLVPSIAELDPVHQLEGARGHVFYAGPMYWNPPWAETSMAAMPQRAAHHQQNIYVTLGSGGMGSLEDLQRILNGCARSRWNGYVSLGLGSKQTVELPSNLKSGGFTGLRLPLEWADLVVTHGGSSTVLASLLHGKPMVVIPFMSECEMNGRQYVEGTGSGIVARYSEFEAETQKLRFRNRYSSEAGSEFLSTEQVMQAIEEVYTQSSYRESAQRMSLKLKKANDEFELSALLKTLF